MFLFAVYKTTTATTTATVATTFYPAAAPANFRQSEPASVSTVTVAGSNTTITADHTVVQFSTSKSMLLKLEDVI